MINQTPQILHLTRLVKKKKVKNPYAVKGKIKKIRERRRINEWLGQ